MTRARVARLGAEAGGGWGWGRASAAVTVPFTPPLNLALAIAIASVALLGAAQQVEQQVEPHGTARLEHRSVVEPRVGTSRGDSFVG
jgi:hypothetical protein